MALNDDWAQELLTCVVTLEAPSDKRGTDSGEIGRAWVDGTLVVYDLQDVPAWLAPVLEARDEDGNTELADPRVPVST